MNNEDNYLRMQIILTEAAKFSAAFEVIPADEKEYIRHLTATYYAVLNNIKNTVDGEDQAIAFVTMLNEIAKACYMFGYTFRRGTIVSPSASINISLN